MDTERERTDEARLVKRLDRADYLKAVELTQLVSVDALLFDAEGRVLLGRRTNEPARGTWFTPGGRVHKYEAFEAALGRVLSTEVLPPSSFSAMGGAASAARLHGVYRHLYETNAGAKGEGAGGEGGDGEARDGGTDYVNFAYALNAHECYGRSELERLGAGGRAGRRRSTWRATGSTRRSAGSRWRRWRRTPRSPVRQVLHPRAYNRLA